MGRRMWCAPGAPERTPCWSAPASPPPRTPLPPCAHSPATPGRAAETPMLAEIKFCGLTRTADVEAAVALGARYLGAIFAPSPRRRSADEARALFAAVPA